MTNQKNTKNTPKRGRPKTSELSRAEQVKRNSSNYRAREAQKKRDIKNKVNEILVPNIVAAVDLLQSTEVAKGQRIEEAIKLLQITSKQWNQEVVHSRHKEDIATIQLNNHQKKSE